MSFRESLRERIRLSDVVGAGLMAIAAPWVAAYIHSALVFQQGSRLYNAELGGIYFHGNVPPQPSAWTIAYWAALCLFLAWPTFLVLIPFHKRVIYRWLAWICSVGVWLWACFSTEVAYR